MRTHARIEAIIHIISSYTIDQNSQPLDRFLRQYFRQHRYIGSKDRHMIKSMVYQFYRHKAQIEWWCGELKLGHSGKTYIAIMLLLMQDIAHSELSEIFYEGKYAPGALHEKELEKLSKLEGKAFFDEKQPVHVQNNIPEWVFEQLPQEEVSFLSEKAPFDMRVNTLKTERTTVYKWLVDQEIEFDTMDNCQNAIRFKQDYPIAEWDIFQKGSVEVQDTGSQMIIDALPVEPGQKIVDFCAGAGGKTLALAAKMQNKGMLYACDISENRLKRMKVRLKRASVDNVRIQALKSENDQWVKRNAKKIDHVLLDVPCTGTGTWRRNPEARWKLTEATIEDLTKIQANILNSAARMVKPGGYLTYATCSYLQAENEDQIKRFVSENDDFMYTEEKRLSTSQTQTDGYYYCILRRKDVKQEASE